jgi:hypothetical protein
MTGEVVDGSGSRRRGRQYKNIRIVDDPSNHQIIGVGPHIVLSEKNTNYYALIMRTLNNFSTKSSSSSL